MGKLRILLPLGALLAFLGYAGPWVDHLVAGLAILGLTSANTSNSFPRCGRERQASGAGILPAAGCHQPGAQPLHVAP